MKRFVYLLIVAWGFCGLPGSAFGADTLTVGVVDLAQCIRDSEEGRRAYESLKKKKDVMQKRLDKEQGELLKLKNELEKQSMMLSNDGKADKEKVFERKRREFKFLYDDLTEEMRKAEALVRERMLKELGNVVTDFATKGGYTLILERRSGGLMYVHTSVDVTDGVIKAYNATKKGKKK